MARCQHFISSLIFYCCLVLHFGHAQTGYYGKKIGKFSSYAHGIRGDVYAVDETTIFIKDFYYDGTGPDTHFFVGNGSKVGLGGYLVPYPEEYQSREPPILERFENAKILLKLKDGLRIKDIKWLAVWCRRFTVNFGDVFLPSNLEIPKPRILPEFSRLAHGLRSGNISILDSKTFYIPNLHYDGAGPDAYFWVGNGSEPNIHGTKVPNEVGSLDPLRGYQGEDIEVVLPKNLTVYNIEWLSVWCVQYKHNFGHVLIPKDLDVPPALGQTKITTSSTPPPFVPTSTTHDFSNCKEMLDGRVQVQWEVVGDDVKIRVSGKIKDDQYVAFGLSGQENESKMIGGDVVVVAYDSRTQKYIAVDYYMSHLSQCDGEKGVCPDERVGGKNDAILLGGTRKNGVTSVTYMRPLRTNEPVKDKMIPEFETSVIAAIGRLNSRGEANAHEPTDQTSEDIRIDFTSRNIHECKTSLYNLPDSTTLKPWKIPEIIDTDNFTARIGPAGNKRGYFAITGKGESNNINGIPPWGIAWYINDRLIPEITVERGRTYTFIVEGGNDPSNPAKYHPFYITTSPEGGYEQKSEGQRKQQRVLAGLAHNKEGEAIPTAQGRYCEWIHKSVDKSSEIDNFDEFFKTLKLDCQPGQPAKLEWTVAQDTPNLVYYQCFTHNNLGWKIHVVNPGERARREEEQEGLTSAGSTISTIIILFLTSLYTHYFLR
ncbi:protein Skeletor, isoforms B/C isoform X2 [Leptopilina boulardi]|uniref:protein Skeletor, isoforms B/C isoform X2 n=1 Tax=Leptopilina boulardi TaxID=63433 RepID=UPI0021F5065F|nr:protein Skeletor, isoforms B/C isoform X2 [Leptopilina boulardi]